MRWLFNLGLAALAAVAPWGGARGIDAPRAAAQVSYEGCALFGTPVASVADASVPDIAMARLDPAYGPLIIYNPYVVASSLPATRVFFYYHECAHHVLGHTLGYALPLTMEQQADCWAIRELVARGIFGNQEIQQVQWQLANFSPGDWTHLPGPQRAINLYACLQ